MSNAPTMTQGEAKTAAGMAVARPTFPDPSIAIVEFGDALGLLLAERTERDAANRRLVLKKAVYIHIRQDGWGCTAFPEIWIGQVKDGPFTAVEPKSGKVLRHPSRRRYEVSFLTREIFECAIQCLKERDPKAIYELVLVTFGTREGFSVESGSLLAPEDYADVRDLEAGREWMPLPVPAM
jgi:hypothetical protein